MFTIYSVFAVFFITARVVSAAEMPLIPCPGVVTNGELVRVIVPSCNAPPCFLYKNNNYTVEVDFEVSRDTEGLAVTVTGNDIIPGIELPWAGVKRNGCEDMLIGRCPLYDDDYVTYAVNLSVLPEYPNVDLTIKWRMKDSGGADIWCFMLPAKIRA